MVHTFHCLGEYIAVDVDSGAVHVLDKTAYDVLGQVQTRMPEGPCPDWLAQRLPEYSRQELEGAWSDLQELQKAGLLFTDDSYLDPQAAVLMQQDAPIKALCLHVSHDCNLRCQYCFASTGDFGTGHRMTMDVETAKKAIDFVIQRSGNRRNIEVDFFGGEPLMAMDTVKATVEYARSLEKEHNKSFRFTITTNGVLLNDEIMEFCNREMSNVVLSLDGRPEVNDYMRPFRNGKGSYSLIVPKFQKFAELRGDKDYYVRGTFTRKNLDFSKDVLHFADLGFKKMSIEPVVSLPDEPFAIREEDLPQIMEEYDNLAKEYIRRWREGRGFTFFHFMIDLNQGPCVAKRLSGCGSGTEYLAVTPWGDLYPCHQFVGEEGFLLGNVDEGITNTAVRDEFKLCNVYAKDKCKNCFARFYCSGGCAANSYKFHGSITDAYDIGCEMQKKRIECAIMIKAALADGDGAQA